MKYPVAKKHFASEKSSLIIDITFRKCSFQLPVYTE